MTEENKQRIDNPFAKRIFDRETGLRLVCRLHADETPAKTFHFNSWEKGGIAYDEVMWQTAEALRKEKRQALHVLTMLESEEGSREIQACLEPYSEQARALFAEMSRIEAPDLQNYQQMRDGRMSEEEYQAHRREIDEALLQKDAGFAAIMEQVEHLKRVFSARNPWLKHFSRIEVTDRLEKEQITKWVGSLLVDHLETVELILPEKYRTWKAELPQKWMEI